MQKQLRTFGTTKRELLNLREWLLGGLYPRGHGKHGRLLEAVYAILEGGLEIVVANAQHVKKVPGRETDVKDTEWIADLLCHGLLRSSFVPPQPIRELRDLTRYRRKLVESQSAERNRLLSWGAPISSWRAWLAMYSDSPAFSCCKLWWKVKPPREKWRSWPKESCARRSPNLSWP